MWFFKYKMKARRQFEDRYGIRVTDRCTVEHSGRDVYPGRFILKFPRWKHAKADGTQDKRVHDNEVIMEQSVLWIDEFRIISDCFAIVELVRLLRAREYAVSLCAQEQKKLDERNEEWKTAFQDTTIRRIVERFEKNPTRFEAYCAMLFEQLGYQTFVTPPVNDGGYDIKLFLDDALYALVECKLYNPSSRVSRPIVQKLVGANEIARAPHLFVVTTSTYTKEAVDYARDAGVRLIDGNSLCELVKRAIEHEEVPVLSFAQLTEEDLRAYIAPDIDPGPFTDDSVSGL